MRNPCSLLLSPPFCRSPIPLLLFLPQTQNPLPAFPLPLPCSHPHPSARVPPFARILCRSPLSLRPQFPRDWPGGRRRPRRLEEVSVRQGPPAPAPAPATAPHRHRHRPRPGAQAAERGRRWRQVPGTGHRSGQRVRGGMRHRGMPGTASAASVRPSPGGAGMGAGDAELTGGVWWPQRGVRGGHSPVDVTEMAQVVEVFGFAMVCEDAARLGLLPGTVFGLNRCGLGFSL